ncbi:MAG: hypothetical protein RR320_04975, partial [Oscillospiraceae bacterium]
MAFQFGNQGSGFTPGPGGEPTSHKGGAHFFKSLSRGALGLTLALVLLVLGSLSFTVVEEGYMGVKYQFGKIVDIGLSPGLNF